MYRISSNSFNVFIIRIEKLQKVSKNISVSEESFESKPSALLSFRAENARSFRDEFEFSMLATAMSEREYVRELPWRKGGSPRRVLPVAGVFGANASGKSNLLKVMQDMRSYVLNSFRSGNPSGGIPRDPFLLDLESKSNSSAFAIEIVLQGIKHDYGFVLDDSRVLEEWACCYPNGRATLLFHREDGNVQSGTAERSRTRAVEDLLRPNALYLSTAAAANHPLLLPLYFWFQSNMWMAEGNSQPFRQALTADMLDTERRKQAVLELLWAADLGIVDAQKQELDPVMQERMQRVIRILTGTEGEAEDGVSPVLRELAGVELVHRGLDDDIVISPDDESLGTMVWFGLVGPILQSLEAGTVLLVDELDTSLHTHLVQRIVQLFQDPETNPNLAQLIFNSHDTNLLANTDDFRLLGRDQIWFTEKSNQGNSHLFSLREYNPRKQEALEKRYLDGYYGGNPILISGGFNSAINILTGVVDETPQIPAFK